MAIRYRKDRNAWQVYWTNPFTKKRESKTVATEMEAKKEDSLIKHRLEFERESFREEDEEEDQNVLTLNDLSVLYLKSKKFEKATLVSIVSQLKSALKVLGEVEVSEITLQHLKDLQDSLLSEELKTSTVYARMKTLRTVLYWGEAQELCKLPKFPKLPHAHYTAFVPPTVDEIKLMLEHAPAHIQRVILLGSQCGMRIGPCELFALRWEDVDLTQSLIRIHTSKKNKNAPLREVPIRSSLLPVIKQWHEEDSQKGIAYVISYNGKHVNSIDGAWHNMLKNAGITRRIRPYDLRHAFATEGIAAGVDIGTLAKLMGHANPTMILKHYQFVCDKQKKEAVEALPDIMPLCPSHCAQKKKVK